MCCFYSETGLKVKFFNYTPEPQTPNAQPCSSTSQATVANSLLYALSQTIFDFFPVHDERVHGRAFSCGGASQSVAMKLHRCFILHKSAIKLKYHTHTHTSY